MAIFQPDTWRDEDGPNDLQVMEEVIRMEGERNPIGTQSSVVELIEAVESKLDLMRDIAGPGSAGREIALSITHLEDAKMRYVRARCIQNGNFDPSYDPDR